MGGGKRGLDPKTLPRVSLLKRHSYRNSFSSENGVQRAQNSFLRRKTDFSKTPPPKIHHRGWKLAEDASKLANSTSSSPPLSEGDNAKPCFRPVEKCLNTAVRPSTMTF